MPRENNLKPIAGIDDPVYFRLLVESSPDRILTLDAEGTILSINHTLANLSTEELIGTDVMSYVEEYERPAYREALDDVFSNGVSRSLELSAAGLTCWLTKFIPVKHDDRVETVLVIATDLSERKRAEVALVESENKFRALAETGSAAIFIFRDAKILYANPMAERITGFTVDEILEMNFGDIVYLGDREAPSGEMGRHLAERVPARREVKLRTKTGEVRWVDYTDHVFDYHGEPTVLGTAVDTTERKNAEEERRKFETQVQHAQKLESLAVLTGGIAHNFNNLLTGILGSASLAASRLPEGSPAEEQIARILRAAEKAATLTNQMLAYAGKENFEVGFVDFNQLIGDVIPLVRTAISKNTVIRESWAANLPTIEADPVQLRQVVVALVTNASEALQDEHGEVSIRTGALKNTFHSGTRVFVKISDTGQGMDAETSKKIFDPFFTTKFTGRGLGLAAVQGIVRAHRGDIRVESQIGRGTTVTVFLPAMSSRRAVQGDDLRLLPGSARTILVIDDEQSVREVAQAALQETGFEVLLAGSGHEALDIFGERASEIDAVLLDMSMPRMSGEQTLVKLRRMRPHVKVLLTSGHSEQEVSRAIEGKKASAFIQKPFRASELIDRIRQVVKPGF